MWLTEVAAQIKSKDWGCSVVIFALEPRLPMVFVRYEMASVAIDPRIDVRLARASYLSLDRRWDCPGKIFSGGLLHL